MRIFCCGTEASAASGSAVALDAHKVCLREQAGADAGSWVARSELEKVASAGGHAAGACVRFDAVGRDTDTAHCAEEHVRAAMMTPAVLLCA